MNKKENLLTKIEILQNLLIARATGKHEIEDDKEYLNLRKIIIDNPTLQQYIPNFLITCRNLDQFWQYIKHLYSTYAERRAYLWEEFQPIFKYLEQKTSFPADHVITRDLEKIDAIHIQTTWQKALERRITDPDGAITSARTLIETVCKHILDEMKIDYDDSADLPRLYKETAKALNLAPSQHTEEIFKQILGGCTAVIEGLGSLRNRLSDAHGRGINGIKPAPRHAELAVNLSGSLASYLLATWEFVNSKNNIQN